jgi:hypothetical protein
MRRLAIVGLALLILAASASARPAATSWAGEWLGPGDASMTLTQSGTLVSGTYGTNTQEYGRISGAVQSGGKMTGRFTRKLTTVTYEGDIELTLGAGGKSFTGRFIYDSDPGAGWRPWGAYTCFRGACLANGAPSTASKPKKQKPKTQEPTAPKTAKSTRTVAAPAPGQSVTVEAPKPTPTAKKATLTVTGSMGLGGTTIVADGGETKPGSPGEAVAACWLIGPDALQVTTKVALKFLGNPKVQEKLRSQRANERLITCLYFVLYVMTEPDPARLLHGPSAGCGAQRVELGVRQEGSVVHLRAKVGTPADAAVRYSCTAKGSATTLTANAGGGLRSALGETMELGVARTPDAPTGGTLRFDFGW